MNNFKGKAIVLKEVNVGESDKIITILMKEKGKLSVSAKGARKPKSKFLAGTQLFTYSDFVIKDSGRFLLLSQVDVIESFYELRNDYDKFCFATYFLELSDKAILENMFADKNLYLLIKSLQALSKDILEPTLVSCIFQFKFLQLNGYAPEINCCSFCGNIETLNFFGNHGVICDKCLYKETKVIKIKPATIYAIRYILENNIQNLFSFKVSNEILLQLKAIAKIFMEYHLDVNLKSQNFFNEL